MVPGANTIFTSRDYKAIIADETRSKGEKAPLLARQQAKYKSVLASKVDAVQFNLESRASKLENAVSSASSVKGSDAAQILMAQQLQGSKDKLALVKADPMYYQVHNSLPADFFGIPADSLTSLKETGLKKHFPAITAEVDQYKTDVKQMNTVMQVATYVDKAFTTSISPEAMQTRFEPETE
ncbi:MAG: hypothetical protein ACJAVV_001910 [Alphaproteobacteria bacterium]|jgi:hypothetical protein